VTLALILLVTSVSVITTIALAARMWQGARQGAPREQLVGYVAGMLLVTLACAVVLRLL
jgi:hypothetical protein